jgi:outer membrane protein
VLAALATPISAQETAATGTFSPPARGTQFVFVNTQAILPQVPGAQQAQQTFNQELAGYNNEVQRLSAEVDSMLAVYRQQEAMLSEDAKAQRQAEILAKQEEAQARAAQLEQDAGSRQQELLAPILERVSTVIEMVRAENEGVVAADPNLDITPLVLERLTAPGASSQNP